jgi:hypothetical protein
MKRNAMAQRILVFQQKDSGEKKIRGIRKYGGELFRLDTISIDQALPVFLEDTGAFLPETIDADLVLDFLKHPDLSYDLALQCNKLDIPVIASGKKWPAALTPVT